MNEGTSGARSSFKAPLLPKEQTRPEVARKRARWKAH